MTYFKASKIGSAKQTTLDLETIITRESIDQDKSTNGQNIHRCKRNLK